MVIFRTSPETISEVVRLSKHALDRRPSLRRGEFILISQTVANSKDGKPPIRYAIESVRIYPDSKDESTKIWGKKWHYIVEGQNCRALKHPFNIQHYQISDQNYAQGGPFVYVTSTDAELLKTKGLLETF